jgi:uncharacterized protein YndB with AHSA1/START domain
MNQKLETSSRIEITASPEAVWEVLTHAELIKEYLFGTKTDTDWKVGSPISFTGEFSGQQYQDKGNVLEVVPKQKLQYNYWSSFSGLEDKLENYFIVTYLIKKIDNQTVEFTWHQAGFPNEERREHTQSGLPPMLQKIKALSEKM